MIAEVGQKVVFHLKLGGDNVLTMDATVTRLWDGEPGVVDLTVIGDGQIYTHDFQATRLYCEERDGRDQWWTPLPE